MANEVVKVGGKVLTGPAARLLLGTKKAAAAAGTKTNEVDAIIVGVDATGSREPTWVAAQRQLAELLQITQGQAEIYLAYFRGGNDSPAQYQGFGWTKNSNELVKKMSNVTCRWGATQIEKFLSDVKNQANGKKVNLTIFIGDMFEEHAGFQNMLGIAAAIKEHGPVHFFQEGFDRDAAYHFAQLAEATGGVHAHFTPGDREMQEQFVRLAFASASPKAAKTLGISSEVLSEPARRLAQRLSLPGHKPGGVD